MQYLSWERTCYKINGVVMRGEVDEVVAVAKVMGKSKDERDQLLVGQ
jgi:hypothetical protein